MISLCNQLRCQTRAWILCAACYRAKLVALYCLESKFSKCVKFVPKIHTFHKWNPPSNIPLKASLDITSRRTLIQVGKPSTSMWRGHKIPVSFLWKHRSVLHTCLLNTLITAQYFHHGTNLLCSFHTLQLPAVPSRSTFGWLGSHTCTHWLGIWFWLWATVKPEQDGWSLTSPRLGSLDWIICSAFIWIQLQSLAAPNFKGILP